MILEKLLAAIDANTAALLRTLGESAAPAEVTPKKTRAQKAIDAAAAAPAPAEPAPAPAPAAPAPSPAQTTAPAVTMEEAIALTKDLAKKDRNAAVATLARHGAPKATDLKPESLAAYAADVRAQLTPPAAAGDGLI